VTVAVSCCVPPATRLTDPGATTTLLTAPAATEIDAVPLVPPAAAVIVVLPECTAVTRPPVEIVATDVLELDHATAWPESTLPLPSVSVAVSCFVPPVVRLDDDGETEMLRTDPADTAAVALPVAPPEDAVIVELPGCTPVTTPLEETVATFVLELDHVAACAGSALPAASVSDTDSCWVPPATRPIEPGETVA
jgi:hypothetical protein